MHVTRRVLLSLCALACAHGFGDDGPAFLQDQSAPQGACGAPPPVTDSGIPGYKWHDPNIDAGEHTTRAIEFAEAGDMERAVKSFQAAARQAKTPDNLINLGVTYMRMRKWSAALEAMLSAKVMAMPGMPGHEHAKSNWEALMQSMVAMEEKIPAKYVHEDPWTDKLLTDTPVRYHFLGQERLHEFLDMKAPPRPQLRHQRSVPVAPSLPRISVEQIDGDDPQFEPYRSRKVPFILTGAMKGWPPAHGKIADLRRLAKLFPEAVTDFYPFNMLTKESQRDLYLTRVGAGADEILHEGASKRFGRHNAVDALAGRYMHLQLTPAMLRKLEEEGEVEPSATRHWHTQGDDWQDACLKTEELKAEFNVKTHWVIILSGQHGAGMFNHSDSLRTSSWHGHVAGRKWWYLCKDGACFESYLEVGEVIYYNHGWAHETQNLVTPTTTITGTVIHENNFKVASEQLRAHCTGEDSNFGFSGALCDALDICNDWWWMKHAGMSRPKGVLPPWRTVASAAVRQRLDNVKSSDNNYDGRNFITEF